MSDAVDDVSAGAADGADEGHKIPLERLNAETDKWQRRLDEQAERHAAEMADLKAQVSGLRAPVTEREYSLSELRKAVDDERITQEQADQIQELQTRNRIERLVRGQVEKTVGETMGSSALEKQIQAYTDLVPQILTRGSDERGKLERAYKQITEVSGIPQAGTVAAKQAEVLACKMAFGDISDLKSRMDAEDRTASRRESHSDGSASGRRGDDGKEPKVWKDMPASKKEYYEGMIQEGFYKDRKAVMDMLDRQAKKRQRS